jgi:hypothetical protein
VDRDCGGLERVVKGSGERGRWFCFVFGRWRPTGTSGSGAWVGGTRESAREKKVVRCLSRDLVTQTTGDERRNVDFSSIDLDSYRRTIPGLGGKTAAIPRDYRAIVVDDVAADPFTFV